MTGYVSKGCHRNLSALLTQLRYLYNESLAERKRSWEERKESVSLYDQFKVLTKRRREDPEWRRYPVGAQRSVLRRLDRAYKHFFREGGYPRFKSWTELLPDWKAALNRLVIMFEDRVPLP